jgi:serine/threonine protein kinase
MLHGDRPSNGVLTLKPGLSDECKRLMRSMLEVETFKRPSTADILESFWVKSYNSGLTISISPKIKTETAT